MAWRSQDQRATLRQAGDGASTGASNDVPEELVGDWSDEWDEEGVTIREDVTLTRGSVGDLVLRFARVEGDIRCVWDNHLAQVDGRRILLGPDVPVEGEGISECAVAGSFWASLAPDDPSTLNIVWTDDPQPEDGPYPVYRNG
jgi:hypothetical protein